MNESKRETRLENDKRLCNFIKPFINLLLNFNLSLNFNLLLNFNLFYNIKPFKL
jgi:hypothetical protein